MTITLSLIVLRQALNFKNSVYLEKTKWTIGIELGTKLLKQILRAQSKAISSLDRGKLIVTIDFECQAVATIFLVHVMLFQLILTSAAYFGIAVVTAPMPSIFSLFLFVLISFLLSFLIKQINMLSTKSVLVRENFTKNLSEAYGAWKIIK